MSTTRPSLLQRALRRFAPSTADLESAELQREVQSDGAVPIRSCSDRQLVHLTGDLSCVTVNPRGGHLALEAEMRDGSGTVTLVWLGRRHIAGVEAGRRLRVSGRISCHEGRRLMYNPRYELLPARAAAGSGESAARRLRSGALRLVR